MKHNRLIAWLLVTVLCIGGGYRALSESPNEVNDLNTFTVVSRENFDTAINEQKQGLASITIQQSVSYDDAILTINEYISITGNTVPVESWHRSVMLPLNGENTVVIKHSGSIGGYAVAFYRDTNFSTASIISGVSLPEAVTEINPVTVDIPAEARYIAFSARKSDTFAVEIKGNLSVKTDDTLTNNTLPPTSKAVGDRFNALEYASQWLWESDCGKPVMHFSFDDVCRCLNDVINNRPTSIWDNAFFGDLKSIHEQTGAVFTLNCFNTFTEIPSYNISNLPATYASELTSAKNWLKFAFHAENDTTNYSTATGIEESYRAFATAIYRFTGSWDCLDRITRLGYFGGNLANVQILQSFEHGITGLLGADDTRISYYLSADESAKLFNKGKYYDAENDMLFIRSQYRTDSYTAQQTIDALIANPSQMKLTEIYMHEQQYLLDRVNYKARLIQLATWANDNGYVHAFPSVIYSK